MYVVCVSRSVMSNSLWPHGLPRQAPLSTEFSRQEYWNEYQFPSLGDLPDPGTERRCPVLQADALPSEPPVSVQFSHSVTSNSLRPHDHSTPGLPVHHQLPSTQTHVHQVGDAIQPSHPLASPSPPAFNVSQHQSFPMSHLFASGGQSTGASASASVLPVNIQDLFPLGLTCWISLQSKGLSRVFSNTTVQKHQFFGTQLSLWSNSHIHTWHLNKATPKAWKLFQPME